MRTLVKHIIALFFTIAFWFRYKVTVKGLEKLTPEALNKPGGVLFLPNHPTVFVDPTMVTLAVWPKFPIRPMIVEYQYFQPIVYPIMRFLDALPIPNFNVSSNSLKRKRSEKVINKLIDALRNGENFLIYPAGKTKSSGYEAIGGASGVHRILSAAPEANVVLVRTKGLWGSSFSRAYTGQSPPLFPTLFGNIKHVLKNLLFFTPRREVIIEVEPAPLDFPYGGSRLEINRYLEKFYNQPDGLTKQEGKLPGDSFIQISLSRWGNVVPEMQIKESAEETYNLAKIPQEIQSAVINKLAEMTEYDPKQIKPDMNIAADLGMDSLDISEVAAYLQDDFDVANVPFSELTTVGRVIAIAAKQIQFKEESVDEDVDVSKWNKPRGPTTRVTVADGATIQEAFLNSCDKHPNEIAIGDARSGLLTYRQLKMRALIVAEMVRKLPGEYIGIMLPASVGAEVVVQGVLLAGKIPLMVNWTVGPRHLESVVKVSNVQVILTAWSFIDRLENVDLTPIEDILVMLEDLRHTIGLKDKLTSVFRARQNAKTLMKKLNIDHIKSNDPAVIIFTSGSEALPKGVPLTHNNILSNLRGLMDNIAVYSNDVLLGMLPPFHSFGFTVTTMLPVLVGIRVAFSPNPTDGPRLAKDVVRWDITVMGGTPTFIKGIMKQMTPEAFKNVRLCFTGAEKAPAELFQMMKDFGKEDFLLEGYGITECSPILTYNRYKEPHKGVGRPNPGVDLLVVHPETHEVLPTNTQGLILARGPSIFSGYINPGLSSPFLEVNGKQWYKTGDLGFLDEAGNLTLSGRLKRFIKVGAEMVSLASLEDAIVQAGVKHGWPANVDGPPVAVCAKEVNGDKPKLYVFSVHDMSVDEVNKILKDAGFANIIRISGVMHLMAIPVMGSGKTNYRVLETDFISKIEEKKEKAGNVIT